MGSNCANYKSQHSDRDLKPHCRTNFSELVSYLGIFLLYAGLINPSCHYCVLPVSHVHSYQTFFICLIYFLTLHIKYTSTNNNTYLISVPSSIHYQSNCPVNNGSVSSLLNPSSFFSESSSNSTSTTKFSNKKQSSYSESSLKCFYTNATSLNSSKLGELSLLSAANDYHLLFITETWFSDISITHIAGYSVYRHDRISHGGGVAIYVRNDIECAQLDCISFYTSEQLWLEVRLNREKIILGCIYRPPSVNNRNNTSHFEFDEICKNIRLTKMLVDQGKYDGLLIAGDFNFPNLVWSSEHYFAEVNGSDSCFASVFLDLLNDESIVQHVNFPTFMKSDLSCVNFLDLILSDAPERISDLDKLSPLGTADQGHLSISWHYHLKSRSRHIKTTSKKFVYRKGNYD